MRLRGRAPLIAAVVVLAALSLVLVQRGQAGQVSSPFELAEAGRPLLVSQAAETDYEIDVALGDVCAPGAAPVAIRSVRLLGVDGALELAGFAPRTITSRCESEAPQQFIVQVRRVGGESAHADGVEVTYESGGTIDRVRLPSAVTLCRQISEC